MAEDETACELNGDATVYERWSWVQSKLPGIGKDSLNEQQKFKFRSIDAVLKEIRPLFGKAGVFVIPARQEARYEERNTRGGGVTHVCKLRAMWQIYGVKGDHFTAETVGESADSFDKGTSKAQTMAFKYLLWPSLAIAENEDPDGETQGEGATTGALDDLEKGGAALRDRVAQMDKPRAPSAADPATAPQLANIRRLCGQSGYAEDGTDVAKAVTSFGEPGWPGGLSLLEKWQASRLIDWLKGD